MSRSIYSLLRPIGSDGHLRRSEITRCDDVFERCPDKIFFRGKEIRLVRCFGRHPNRLILKELEASLQRLRGDIDGKDRGEEIRIDLFHVLTDRPEMSRRVFAGLSTNLFHLTTIIGAKEDHDGITFRVVQLLNRRRSDVQQTMAILNSLHRTETRCISRSTDFLDDILDTRQFDDRHARRLKMKI